MCWQTSPKVSFLSLSLSLLSFDKTINENHRSEGPTASFHIFCNQCSAQDAIIRSPLLKARDKGHRSSRIRDCGLVKLSSVGRTRFHRYRWFVNKRPTKRFIPSYVFMGGFSTNAGWLPQLVTRPDERHRGSHSFSKGKQPGGSNEIAFVVVFPQLAAILDCHPYVVSRLSCPPSVIRNNNILAFPSSFHSFFVD